jgi:hypothetical protein
MGRARFVIGLLAAITALEASAAPLSVKTSTLRAGFELGTLTSLRDTRGHPYVGGEAAPDIRVEAMFGTWRDHR